jgi:hypothetical protein
MALSVDLDITDEDATSHDPATGRPPAGRISWRCSRMLVEVRFTRSA